MKVEELLREDISRRYYRPKFRLGDTVCYNGQEREGCDHNRQECGKVLKLPDSSQPFYTIGVMAYDGSPLIINSHNSRHPVTFLTTGDKLQLWDLAKEQS